MAKHIIEHFKTYDPVIFDLITRYSFINLRMSDDYFIFLCESIISQQLSVKASDTIFERFKNLFKNAHITPKETLLLSPEEMRSAGLSRTKVTYIKDLSQKVMQKEIDLEKLPTLTDDQIIAELIKVKGIGIWTAEMFLMSALNREDVFSYGDLGLRKAIQILYDLSEQPTKQQAEEISLKWSPYRSYACRLLWRSLTKK